MISKEEIDAGQRLRDFASAAIIIACAFLSWGLSDNSIVPLLVIIAGGTGDITGFLRGHWRGELRRLGYKVDEIR